MPPDRWEAILEDLEGNLWVRSEHHWQCDRRLRTAFSFDTTGDSITAGHEYYSGAGAGSSRQSAGAYQSWSGAPNGPGWEIVGAEQGLTTNDISAVQQDREGSIWLGLLGSGLARWLGYREWQSWNEHEGLSRESVWSIARDATGRCGWARNSGSIYARRREETGG